MTSRRITFEGPADLAIGVATALAEAEGVELTSSDPLAFVGDDTVRLAMTADGSVHAIARAVDSLRADLPLSAAITVGDA